MAAGLESRRMAPDPITDLETQALWDASVDGLLLVDEVGVILATNASLDKQFAYADGALVGQDIEALLPTEHRTAHVGYRTAFNEDPQPRPMAARNLEGLREDGTTFPINVSLAPVNTSAGLVTFAAVRDLTARVEYENALTDANRRRAMAEDHDRIANDLHDSVIQRLFALGLGLQGLPSRLADPELADRVSAAVDALDEIILDIRTTIYGLRASTATARLRLMILDLATEVEPVLGFVPDISLAGGLDSVLDETLKGHVVAVIREALSNAGRHAGASAVSVQVSVEDDLVIRVIDNGRGVDKANIRSSGLGNMRQRAEDYGGSFSIEAVDRGGTEVRWVIPGDQIF